MKNARLMSQSSSEEAVGHEETDSEGRDDVVHGGPHLGRPST